MESILQPEPEAAAAHPPAQSPRLAAHGLRHAYGAGARRREVLHGVDMEFWSGEITMILGPSGSGKTTFLTLAGGLRRIQEGSLRVEGLELKGATAEALTGIRRRIGFIFQNHNLLASLDCLENVQISLACDPFETAASSRQKALAALAQVGLARMAGARPRDLSQGQQQRVAVARALVHGPGIILADEPTASLDRDSGQAVVELLQEHARRRGCAILVVTHDPRILEAADRILQLNDGCLFQASAHSLTSTTVLKNK